MREGEHPPEAETSPAAAPRPPACAVRVPSDTPRRLEAWGKALLVLHYLLGVAETIVGILLISLAAREGTEEAVPMLSAGVTLVVVGPFWIVAGFLSAAWHDAAAEALWVLHRIAGRRNDRGDHPDE